MTSPQGQVEGIVQHMAEQVANLSIEVASSQANLQSLQNMVSDFVSKLCQQLSIVPEPGTQLDQLMGRILEAVMPEPDDPTAL